MSLDTTDKSCTITLHNQLGLEPDETMLHAVMARMARHVPQATSIDIYPANRESATFAEWIARVVYRHGGGLTIGCVQREVGSQVEFHS